MTFVTAIGAALFGGAWGALLIGLVLRPSMRRQMRAAEALQRSMADLQGQYWTLRQCLVQPGAAPTGAAPSPEPAAGVERLYDRAIRMARQGARVDDLTESCGLGRAEAELVVRLHATPGVAPGPQGSVTMGGDSR